MRSLEESLYILCLSTLWKRYKVFYSQSPKSPTPWAIKFIGARQADNINLLFFHTFRSIQWVVGVRKSGGRCQGQGVRVNCQKSTWSIQWRFDGQKLKVVSNFYQFSQTFCQRSEELLCCPAAIKVQTMWRHRIIAMELCRPESLPADMVSDMRSGWLSGLGAWVGKSGWENGSPWAWFICEWVEPEKYICHNAKTWTGSQLAGQTFPPLWSHLRYEKWQVEIINLLVEENYILWMSSGKKKSV